MLVEFAVFYAECEWETGNQGSVIPAKAGIQFFLFAFVLLNQEQELDSSLRWNDEAFMSSGLPLFRSPLTAMHLILYQRDDCHLCDLALDVLASARAPDFDSVFIDDDAALEARYGERVPVLRENESGRELDWPFDGAAVARFLQG